MPDPNKPTDNLAGKARDAADQACPGRRPALDRAREAAEQAARRPPAPRSTGPAKPPNRPSRPPARRLDREAAEQAARPPAPRSTGPARPPTAARQPAGLDRAREVAGEAPRSRPYVEKAAGLAAQGVSAAAERIDKATGGKYSDTISAVTTKIEETLDRKPPTH